MEVYGSPGDFPADPRDSPKSLQWALAQSRYSGSDSTNNLKLHCIDSDPGCISQVRMGLGSKSTKWGLGLDLVSDPTVSTFGQFWRIPRISRGIPGHRQGFQGIAQTHMDTFMMFLNS